MLEVKCKEHLDEVFEFAKTLGKEAVDSLEKALYRYRDDENKVVVLMYEKMAPHSFYFDIYTVKDGARKFWYNGGIIFHDNRWGTHT